MVPVYDLQITDALLSTTRSVRKRLDVSRRVERDVLSRCIELSLQAPTGSNAQNWRWIVVTDTAKRKALADIYCRGASEYLGTGDDGQMSGLDEQTNRVLDSARYLMEILDKVPVHVIPCIEVDSLPDTTDVSYWASLMGSIMPAVWSFNLALRARGLGTVLTTLHLDLADEAATLLEIPKNVLQVGLLPVAYTKGVDFKPAKRPPVETILHWDHWSD